MNEEDTTEIEEFIEDIDYGFENVEEMEFLKELRVQLEKSMIQTNTLKERQVLEFRYGWNTSILTLEEIGEIYNISRGRVRGIEVNALRNLMYSRFAIDKIRKV